MRLNRVGNMLTKIFFAQDSVFKVENAYLWVLMLMCSLWVLAIVEF